jgi:hypothetical protein
MSLRSGTVWGKALMESADHIAIIPDEHGRHLDRLSLVRREEFPIEFQVPVPVQRAGQPGKDLLR